ncbi:MAG TPA: YcaO-like family protein [Mycobacterium sp.]|nr:YcaO-like family protein [Mycobacterium sp.]
MSWADAKYGPVSGLGGMRMAHPEPEFWVFAADFTRTPVGNWFGGNPTGAAGASIYADEALLRCLGEVAERYSALTAPIEGTVRPVDPEFIRMFPRCAKDEECSPILRGDIPESPVTHVPMTWLANGERVEVPAGYAHLTLPPPSEPLMTTPISSGLAFDPSLETALWRGICEVAERDALMLTWWQRKPVAEIDVGCGTAGLPGSFPHLADRLSRVAAASLRARFFDITTDFSVPTVVCILTGDRFPFLTVGAACRGAADAACAKSLDEAVAIRLAINGAEGFAPPSLDDFNWLEDLEDHARLYAAGHLRHALDFLLDGDQSPITLSQMAERPALGTPRTMAELRDVATNLQHKGLTVLWTDLTAPELSSDGHVVKVVIPQMVPLPQLHRVRWLGTARLRRSGDDEVPLAASFNPYPHPFA